LADVTIIGGGRAPGEPAAYDRYVRQESSSTKTVDLARS
jgi:hypothetical protein